MNKETLERVAILTLMGMSHEDAISKAMDEQSTREEFRRITIKKENKKEVIVPKNAKCGDFLGMDDGFACFAFNLDA